MGKAIGYRPADPLRHPSINPANLRAVHSPAGCSDWARIAIVEGTKPMSMSEIADNKWEVDAARPPTRSFSAICQILLIAAFTGIFVYIVQGAASGIFGPKRQGGMAESYGKMSHEAAPKN
jgi:hypothetical protein